MCNTFFVCFVDRADFFLPDVFLVLLWVLFNFLLFCCWLSDSFSHRIYCYCFFFFILLFVVVVKGLLKTSSYTSQFSAIWRSCGAVKTTGVVCVAASPFTLQVCAFFLSAPFSLECAKSVYRFVPTNLCVCAHMCVWVCVSLMFDNNL